MLTGDLTDFSLTEVLGFLGTTAVSGTLQLRSDVSDARIALHAGGVCLALPGVQGVTGVAARLVRAGAIEVEQLRSVQCTGLNDVVGAAMAVVEVIDDQDAASSVVREHTTETLSWLTRRDQATFAFERSEDLEDWPFDPVPVDDVLAAVERQAAEWDGIAATVGDLTRIAHPTSGPAGNHKISVTPEQWRLISLVDGQRSLMELIELSGLGFLSTCRAIDQLAAMDLVELADPGTTSELSAQLDCLTALGGAAAALVTADAVATTAVSLSAVVDRTPSAASTDDDADDALEVPEVVETTVVADADDDVDADDVDADDVDVDASVDVDADDVLASDGNRNLLQRLLGVAGGDG